MNKLRLVAFFFLGFLVGPGPILAQGISSPASTGPFSPNLSPEQLDELVAPVALYPDPLLADVVTASTYPLEVVDANHWAADPENSGLSGDDLTDALNARGWDASVQSLVPFPQVLELMDGHVDWMEALGEAFLAQPADVMDAVQRMRARAQGAGNLPSNGEETVGDQDNLIAISPPSDLVYVPQYDPWCAFGPWPYPVGPQSYFGAWSGSCDPAEYGVEFSPGIAWPFAYWSWGYFDWRRHQVLVRPDMYRQFHSERSLKGSVWKHDPQHRDGLNYRNPKNIRTYGQPARSGVPQVRSEAPLGPYRPFFRGWNSTQIVRIPPRQSAPSRALRGPIAGRASPRVGTGYASRPSRHP